MSQLHQYFATRPKISIVMPNGNRISFIAGSYITDDENEIKFLDDQIKDKHPMIFVKKGEETVTKEQLDPLAAVKEKVIADYLAKQKEQQDPSRDFGNTEDTGVYSSVATTKTIAPITIGSKSK